MTMIATVQTLVVEDHDGTRFFLEEMLTRDGHQVVAVESGEAALELMATREFDLALLDLKLTGIGGMQVLAALHQQSPDTVVIVLTAHGSLETAVEALRQGAHDYLFKPVNMVGLRESVRTGLLKRQRRLQQRELLTQLKQYLAGAPEASPAALVAEPASQPSATVVPASLWPTGKRADEPTEDQARFLKQGGLIVDLMRHVISLDGNMLELSPTEFALLAYLASEAPRVISPQELVQAVQGYECEPWEASNTLRYHIHRIRLKIKQATGRSDLIHTTRGVGYTLVKERGDD
jgi:DNA-binding response OmpR family regulator